ncbi:hypothetical protein EVAR_81653_1 [Eumeta japonica]|uniref:Uncharacterized protein n=1 Tax=Eumeta variegata TaxID=151549 RepID=A0A4C1V3Q7_EUMVA|nr:hypothetical protein EVAR_81653_1 [Eumeta japonica]
MDEAADLDGPFIYRLNDNGSGPSLLVKLTKQFTCRLCAAAVSLLLERIGRWSGREIDASQAEKPIVSLSLVPRSCSHARLRWNVTLSHAFSCV